ncbi:MAG: TonB-dependent receptor plug domain-containing protein, partial [Gammaproteobacteria bacterium]
RIEVIRGPGSAVYGADAFAGVINIITKTALDIDGTEIGGRYGSFDTWDGWLLHGGIYKGFEVAAMLEYHDTDGQRETIEADAQTRFDSIFRTDASIAPGPVNVERENIDARLDIRRENWRLRAGLQRRQDLGTGVGLAQALDPNGRFESDRWNVDLTYHNPLLTGHWDVEAQVSYFDTSREIDRNALLFPPGTVLPIGPDGNIRGGGVPTLFPNGFIGNPEVFERHARFNVSAFYSGFDRHLLRMGTGFNYANIWKVQATQNFGINPSTGTLISPNGPLVDVSDTPFIFLPEDDRKNYYLFLQDSWRFANDWELTGGVRYDNFSDFGNTVNPRFALVWQTRQNLTSKLLYGEAFRAPSFAETRNINNPVTLGNPDLEPEKIRTVDLAFDYLPTEDLRLSSNVYRYWWSEIIRFVPNPGATSFTAQNTGEQSGYGLEIEADWRATPYFRLLGNYAFQISKDDASDEDAGNAPHHQVYARADWEFLSNWHFDPQVNWILDRDRLAGDNRPEIDDYSTVDLTLRRTGIHNHWDLAFSVRNLFDSDVREPSLAGSPAASIPNDLPLSGRSFYGEVRFRF